MAIDKAKTKPKTPTTTTTAPGSNPLIPEPSATTTTTPPGGSSSTGGVGLGTDTPGGNIWDSSISTSQWDTMTIPILGQDGQDPLQLATLIPEVGKGHPAKDLAGRVNSVSQMTEAQQQQLGAVLNQADELAAKSTAYTPSEIQSALTSALKHAAENQSPSLSAYLEARIAQNKAGNAASSTGAVNELVASMQTTADDYGLPASATGLSAQAQQLLDSGMTVSQADATYKQQAQEQAAGLYPNFAAQISAGQTTKSLLSPYASLAEKTIGVDPTTINWQSPLWSSALAGPVDKTTNRASVASLSDFSKTLMQNPAFNYQGTQEANNAAGSLVSSLLKLFGQIPDEALSTSMSGPTPDLTAT